MAIDSFVGLQYPLMKTPRGIMAQKKGVDQIKADLLQLLLTNPGERCMLPDFGTPLRKLIFEPNDSALEMKAKEMIINSIRNWEPRVIIQSIEVTSSFKTNDLNSNDPGDDVGHILGIKIEFIDPGNLSHVESLVLQLPIGE